jgi:hypothetical protein
MNGPVSFQLEGCLLLVHKNLPADPTVPVSANCRQRAAIILNRGSWKIRETVFRGCVRVRSDFRSAYDLIMNIEIQRNGADLTPPQTFVSFEFSNQLHYARIGGRRWMIMELL